MTQKPFSWHKQPEKRAKEHADRIFNLLYAIIVLVFAIPVVIELAGTFDVRWGIAFLKFTSLFTILAKPFTTLFYLENATNTLLADVFPQEFGTLVENRYGITGFDGLFNQYLAVPGILMIVPFIFLIPALLYLGYKLPPGHNPSAAGIKFALGHYLGGLAGFVVFWGIGGAIAGFWGLNHVILQLFVVWGEGWLDLVLWLIFASILPAIGSFAASKHPPTTHEAAETLVSSLQQPTPRVYPASHRGVYIATHVHPAVPRVQQPVEAPGYPPQATPGQSLVRRQYCEFCGSKVEAGMRFCPGCGVNIAGDEPAMAKSAASYTTKQAGRPVAYIEIPTPGAIESRPAVSPPGKGKQKLATEAEIEAWERAIVNIDSFSSNWAIGAMVVSIIAGLVSLLLGNYVIFASCFLALPFGFVVMEKDRNTFSRWVYEHNYSSRGVDLIMYGLMGSLCAGAGLMVLVKGILMLLVTQNTPEQYPALTGQQWRARAFQASMTIAGTWMLLATIAGISRFAEFTPLGMTWALISGALGFAIYSLYERSLRVELVRGNIWGMDTPLIIAGIVGIILNGGGWLILLQGILIAVQKDEKKAPQDLVADGVQDAGAPAERVEQ